MPLMKRVHESFRYGLVMMDLSQLLSRFFKLDIIPFYLIDETPRAGHEFMAPRGCAVAWLSRKELPELAAGPQADYPLAVMEGFLDAGCSCLVARIEGRLAACLFANPTRCVDKMIDFPLAANEVYVFGVRTFKAYRGYGLAGFLRQELITRMAPEGKSRLISVTKAFNTPALTSVRKIGARPFRLYLFLSPFGLFRKLLLLRDYSCSD
jgi:GNAT superfamily N-acetyltransferase